MTQSELAIVVAEAALQELQADRAYSDKIPCERSSRLRDVLIRSRRDFYTATVAYEAGKQKGFTTDAWISVKSRMPIDDGYTGHVLVARTIHYDCQFGDRDVTMAYVSENGWAWDHKTMPVLHDGEEVTHWMPIPDPPDRNQP